jgi:ArsR family transcriptional regulator
MLILNSKHKESNMSNKDYEFLCRKAEILKSIAHPVRLAILKGLVENGSTCVNKLETGGIDVDTAVVSQHLNKIRSMGILKSKRKGTSVFYSINDVDGIVDLIKIFL